MAEVRWTPQAADDLDAIAEFISQDSPHYSNLSVLDVMCAVDRLIQFPKSGRIVPGIDDLVITSRKYLTFGLDCAIMFGV
jgi:toxin ParE1/3/4